MMKHLLTVLGLAATSCLLGCSTTPVALGPVGPSPSGSRTSAIRGQLVVYSALAARSEGNNPTWYQHTDYQVYDAKGKWVGHVGNEVGNYESAPRPIQLAAGKYVVKAQAVNCSSLVEVPVVIVAGRTTKVHLDDTWNPGPGISSNQLVEAPFGYPVGWRVGS